ncbi:response regulator [Sphingobium sp. AR-3-1]|uniref:Response regulator n=1 Tax=Sphingobium psychrophilum TaxID=2728834 RepID=A0A7X9X0B9_9SPHN|nr:response regulator [Sphingobium psychrophilum]MBJ7440851.1 response regulator [Sphingopyxis sp.]NML13127.1 response regulator [Sphingobium psychrophilum]
MDQLGTAASYNFASGHNPPSIGNARDARRMLGVPLDAHILVIEDDAMIAWMVESLLEDLGFSAIRLVASGEDAVAAALVRTPGLIISDIHLGSGMDGVTAAATIVSACSAPVIFITGYSIAQARPRVEAAVQGASLLRKPIQSAELETAIVHAFSAHGAH